MSGIPTPESERLVSIDRLVVAVERAAREGVCDSSALREAVAACASDARAAAYPPQVFLVCVKQSVRAGAHRASLARVEPLMGRVVGHAIDAFYAGEGRRADTGSV